MKYSTMMAIAFCGVLAVAVSGCKYDDDELGAGSGTEVVDSGTSGATDVDSNPGAVDINSNVDEQNKLAAAAAAMKDADTISMDAAMGVPFDQDPNYVRCTDVDFAPVYFGFDSTVVPAGELSKIDAVVQHLNSHSDRVTVIEGNCDERGSNEYNMSLGENRAIIIRNYLIQSGISADRIQTRSYGDEKPAVMGSDKSAWSRNRRGEFAIFQK